MPLSPCEGHRGLRTRFRLAGINWSESTVGPDTPQSVCPSISVYSCLPAPTIHFDKPWHVCRAPDKLRRSVANHHSTAVPARSFVGLFFFCCCAVIIPPLISRRLLCVVRFFSGLHSTRLTRLVASCSSPTMHFILQILTSSVQARFGFYINCHIPGFNPGLYSRAAECTKSLWIRNSPDGLFLFHVTAIKQAVWMAFYLTSRPD